MTHDERISSYIDNELSTEQEQEFLISLAASEGLRKSFRSELVLKKVLHRDESVTTPSHRLRTAVFTTLGLGGIGVAGNSSKASAAQQAGNVAGRGLLKAFFATKVNALITAAGISVSALAGYGVHAVVHSESGPAAVKTVATVHQAPRSHSDMTPSQAAPSEIAPSQVAPSGVQNVPTVSAATPVQPAATHTANRMALKHTAKQPASAKPDNTAIDRTTGGGAVTMEPPTIHTPNTDQH